MNLGEHRREHENVLRGRHGELHLRGRHGQSHQSDTPTESEGGRRSHKLSVSEMLFILKKKLDDILSILMWFCIRKVIESVRCEKFLTIFFAFHIM